MRTLDWSRSYQEHQRKKAAQLRDARSRGVTFFRFGDAGATCNPSRMTDRQIDDAARRDAERVVNMAIITHNEQVERRSA